ncbi:MAG: SDR family NAD(P)-dependent oxidoreductase [Pseudomonadota bacterium]
MTDALKEKHVLITGAGQGIGEFIARLLSAHCSKVTLSGRTLSKLESVADSLGLEKANVVTVDVTEAESVKSGFSLAKERFGSIDILVNNAGQAESAPFSRTPWSLWEQMINVNLHGVYHCCQAVLADMKAQGWGRIINIASTAGLKGYPYTSAYTSAKHGVIGLTRVLSQELAQTGITVNSVCPGFTKTAIVDAALENISKSTGMDEDQALNTLVASNPQKRLIEPEEVANTVLWLCQEASRGINGQSIVIAGGEVT